MSVQQYLEKHMLSRKIKDAINAAVRAKTLDHVILIRGRSSITEEFLLLKSICSPTKACSEPLLQAAILLECALGVQLNEWSRRVQISLFVGLKARTCVSSNYKCLIDAHHAPLATIVLSSNGMYIATASEQGTIIKVHLVSDATKLHCPPEFQLHFYSPSNLVVDQDRGQVCFVIPERQPWRGAW